MTIAVAEDRTLQQDVIRSSHIEKKSRSPFFIFSQTLAWAFFNIYFRFFYSIRVKGVEFLHAEESPLIIIANHFGPLDGFLLNAVSGFACAQRPFRFMAVTKFASRSLNILSFVGIITLVYKVFGVFTVVPGLGMEKNLEKAKEIIYAGGTVVIFPEGKIVSEAAIQPFRKGAATLAISTSTRVTPVAFRKGSRKLLRKSLLVNFGSAVDLSSCSIEEGTERLQNLVTRLYLENDTL